VAAPDPSASILVVDDDEATRNVMVRILRRGGHRATAAHDGPEAVRAMANGGFDLVLLDLMMPGMDGEATALAIRAVHPHARIVFVSGSAPSPIPAGAIAFIPKPFSHDSLLESVRAALERVLEN
jgi:CheY-like chemotaxis protein